MHGCQLWCDRKMRAEIFEYLSLINLKLFLFFSLARRRQFSSVAICWPLNGQIAQSIELQGTIFCKGALGTRGTSDLLDTPIRMIL